MKTPDWKKKFPISQPEEHQVSRRDFVKFLGVSCTAAAGGALAMKAVEKYAALTPETDNISYKEVAKVGEIPVGKTKLFHFPTHEPCLLIHRSEGEYLAFSQSCTHLMCPVHFDAHNDEIVCPCHNGHFEVTTGAVLAGPPKRALPQFPVSVENSMIRVHPQGSQARYA